MNRLILRMPLSTSVLNCARANTIYELADPYNATINVNVKLCHQFWEEKGRGVVLQYPVCSVLNVCAISLGREGPGRVFTPTGLLGINDIRFQ